MSVSNWFRMATRCQLSRLRACSPGLNASNSFLELRPKSTDSYNAAFTAACRSGSAECARLLADQEETKVHENTALLEYNFKYSDEDSDDEVESLERGFYLACKEGGTKS